MVAKLFHREAFKFSRNKSLTRLKILTNHYLSVTLTLINALGRVLASTVNPLLTPPPPKGGSFISSLLEGEEGGLNRHGRLIII